MSPREIAWLWEVTSGVCRTRGFLEHVIDGLALAKPPTGKLRRRLMLALYGIFFQDSIAPERVVDETVESIKRDEGAPVAKFANAVLRKAVSSRDEWKKWLAQPTPQVSERLLPSGWIRAMGRKYGAEWVSKLAVASLGRPDIYLRTNPARQLQLNADFEQADLDALKFVGTFSELRPRLEDGDFLVQDLSSQILIRENFAEVSKRFPKPRVLDLCAAPGGKSVGLAWTGADVEAYDVHANRRESLKQNVGRLAPQVRVLDEEHEIDWNRDWVWIDAPCSGSGLLKRHPEVRWTKSEQDSTSLRATQQKLLANVWAKLPSGSYLTYTVCSLLPEEGPIAIDPYRENLVKEWVLAPHLEPSTDGFYGALLLKK